MPTINSARIAILARRLRYLRRHPQPFGYQANNEQIRLGMSQAYEYALRVVIDELGQSQDFHSLFYGQQNEDPDFNTSIMGN